MDLIKNKDEIIITLIHRASNISDQMMKSLKVPGIVRENQPVSSNGSPSPSEGKTSTIAEINENPVIQTASENNVEQSPNSNRVGKDKNNNFEI